MQTLSYGFKKPQPGDKGSVFFPALEENVQQLNDHTHNGTNSPKLAASAVTATVVNIPAASWVAAGGGRYSQTVSLPLGYAYDEVSVQIRNSDGDVMNVGVEKASAISFEVFCNDNTLTLKAIIS